MLFLRDTQVKSLKIVQWLESIFIMWPSAKGPKRKASSDKGKDEGIKVRLRFSNNKQNAVLRFNRS